MRRLRALAAVLAAVVLAGCVETPDPCADWELACLAVTVEDGPGDVYQLLVAVAGYTSTTPLTPNRRPPSPLPYPLRFAVKFQAFDQSHRGEVTLEVSARDGDNEVRGSARQVVRIDNKEKPRVSLSLGPPFDLAPVPDLRPAPDLSDDMRPPADDLPTGDLADGGGGG